MAGFARALRVVLAAALLAGWQAALVHPLQHADHSGRLVHLSGGSSDQEEHGNGASPLCDAIAALAVCAHGSPQPPAVAPAAAERAPGLAAVAARCAPLLAYRSQAPPRLS